MGGFKPRDCGMGPSPTSHPSWHVGVGSLAPVRLPPVHAALTTRDTHQKMFGWMDRWMGRWKDEWMDG